MKILTFSALSDPNRFRIVELLLVQGSQTVGDIAERLHIRQPQASKHLRVLLDSGLVEVQANANRRHYKLRVEPLQEMDDWLERYRQMWQERYDNLDHYLQRLQSQDSKPNINSGGIPNDEQNDI